MRAYPLVESTNGHAFRYNLFVFYFAIVNLAFLDFLLFYATYFWFLKKTKRIFTAIIYAALLVSIQLMAEESMNLYGEQA